MPHIQRSRQIQLPFAMESADISPQSPMPTEAETIESRLTPTLPCRSTRSRRMLNHLNNYVLKLLQNVQFVKIRGGDRSSRGFPSLLHVPRIPFTFGRYDNAWLTRTMMDFIALCRQIHHTLKPNNALRRENQLPSLPCFSLLKSIEVRK